MVKITNENVERVMNKKKRNTFYRGGFTHKIIFAAIGKSHFS